MTWRGAERRAPGLEEGVRKATRYHYEHFPFVDGGKRRQQHWQKRLAGPLPVLAGATVLDVGCGSGDVAVALRHSGALVVGLDLTRAAVLRTRRQGVTSIQGDALHLPLRNGVIGHTTAIGVLHHTPDCRRALAELARITVPGGRIVAMVYARWTPYHLLYMSARPLRAAVPVACLDLLPRPVLALARLVVWLQRRQHLRDEDIKGLIADQIWTPQASFHSARQLRQWARELGLESAYHKRLFCHANLFAFTHR